MNNIRRFLDPSLRCALSFAACAVAAAQQNSPVPVVTAPPPAEATLAVTVTDNAVVTPIAKPVRLSAGLDEILRLNKAGVEEGVVLAFIQTSPIAYYPTAQEIVILRERGITAPVLTALLQHGAEVRQHNATANANAAAAAPAATAPPPVPEPTPVNPPAVYAASSPTVIYTGYPSYDYGYGGYYGYYPGYASYYGRGGYGYYGGYFPGISVGIGFGGHYGGHYGGYYGSHYGGHFGGHVSTIHASGGFHASHH
jgi:hypothetical protein